MNEAGLEAPLFTSTFFFTALFKRPLLQVHPKKESIGKIPEMLLSTLTDDEIKVCELIFANRIITAAEIARFSGFSERKAYSVLKTLNKKKIVERTGSKKSGSWKLIINKDDQ